MVVDRSAVSSSVADDLRRAAEPVVASSLTL
jgi:hypothetical protein